jgi:predicted ATP-dependent endonuclease of OLD family
VKNKRHDECFKYSTTISPEQLFYSPTPSPYKLGYKKDLTTTHGITIGFREDSNDFADVTLLKGKNKNISVRMKGTEAMLESIQNFEKPYSIYVPGLSGIPLEENYLARGDVNKTAFKGNSNMVLRNILYLIFKNNTLKASFKERLNRIFSGIILKVNCNLNISGKIDVTYTLNEEHDYPIENAGTGVLQAIQIIAYITYFKPKFLLLDEPDAHLHPNNISKLASLLKNLVSEPDAETTICISTHSRKCVCELESSENTNYFVVASGSVTVGDIAEIEKILEEIGSFDKYDAENKRMISKLKHSAQPIVLVEGQTDKDLLEFAYGKLGRSLDFQIVNGNGSPEVKQLILSAKNMRLSQKVIALFDRDESHILKDKALGEIGIHRFAKLEDKVFACAYPNPRDEEAPISIEHYFTDAELSTEDNSQRRLYMCKEFNAAGNLKDNQDRNCQYLARLDLEKRPHEIKVLSGNGAETVRDAETREINYSLSKADFVQHIIDSEPGYSDFDFTKFGEIMDLINDIISDDNADARPVEAVAV